MSSPGPSSIDELDAAICRLARQVNTETYRMLELVREFDDRLGWAKWGYRSCAEWLSWRCDVSLSAAREQVRTAQALRDLPAISAAFAGGRLSYTKARALTRAADACNEDLLLAYALGATAPQVEERCRQIRNVAPDSVDVARGAWERRALSVWRDPGRGTMRITIEVPIEEGEVIANALDRAVEAGEAAKEPEFAANGWQAQQAEALVAVARAYLAGGVGGADACAAEGDMARADGSASGSRGHRDAPRSAAADHYQVVVHVDEAALHGGAGRSDLPIDTVKRLLCDGSMIGSSKTRAAIPSTSAGSSAPCRRRSGAPCSHATAVARSRVATARATSRVITSAIGSTVAARASTTRPCSAPTITGCCTKARIGSGAIGKAQFTSNGRMGA